MCVTARSRRKTESMLHISYFIKRLKIYTSAVSSTSILICKLRDTLAARLYYVLLFGDTAVYMPAMHVVAILLFIIKIKIHSSCEIEDFVETHLRKLCVILRSRVLRVVCPH